MPREFGRPQRVAAEIQKLVNELLLTEVKDPRLHGVSVSAVEVSGDLSLATVFFSTLALDDDPGVIREGFEQARGFIRTRVGRALQMRRVPELRFRHDTSAQRAVEIGQLIDKATGAPRHED